VRQTVCKSVLDRYFFSISCSARHPYPKQLHLLNRCRLWQFKLSCAYHFWNCALGAQLPFLNSFCLEGMESIYGLLQNGGGTKFERDCRERKKERERKREKERKRERERERGPGIWLPFATFDVRGFRGSKQRNNAQEALERCFQQPKRRSIISVAFLL
jgi:hypothetical protein